MSDFKNSADAAKEYCKQHGYKQIGYARIAFEAGYNYNEKRVLELEAGLKQCQVDRDELQEERDRYEKALREIYNDGCDSFEIASSQKYVNRVAEVTDRALNFGGRKTGWDE